MAEANFVNGLRVEAPREGAPDFVKAKGSIKREEMIAWLSAQTGDWINFDVNVSRAGKWYCKVSEYKKPDAPQEYRAEGSVPNTGFGEPPAPDYNSELPF
jgi:hypothetical protein